MSSDISGLLVSQPLPHSAVLADAGLMKAADQGAPQGVAKNTMVVTAVAGSVAAAILVVTILMARRMRRRRLEDKEAVIMKDMPEFMEASAS